VEKEVRAIKVLCRLGAHENVVQVYHHGLLWYRDSYFIDMELCNLSLHDYIHQKTPVQLPESLQPFLKGDGSSLPQIWTIMSQIAKGVEYIHSQHQIHRDIKPSNGAAARYIADLLVLYSLTDVWKLADFGLSTDGTSKSYVTTHYGYGTPGYRAPELLMDDEMKYTNKVDIWATGCILYELATGKRLFYNDWEIFAYHSSNGKMEIVLSDTFDELSSSVIIKNVLNMIQIDPSTRTSAATLAQEFINQFQRTQTNQQIGIQLDAVISSINLLTPMDQPEEIQPVAEQHPEAGADETKRVLAPALPVVRFPGYNLPWAVSSKKIGDVMDLLNAKADVDARRKDGETGLMWAAKLGLTEIAKMLVVAKANLDIKATEGNTALIFAVRSRHTEIVKLLVDAKANVNIQGHNSTTALISAAGRGCIEVVKVLLDAGAHVNIKRIYGETALMCAAGNGQAAIVKVLLDAKANVDARDIDGYSALHRAKWGGHTEVVKMLQPLQPVFRKPAWLARLTSTV
jgi:hypothetical protein